MVIDVGRCEFKTGVIVQTRKRGLPLKLVVIRKTAGVFTSEWVENQVVLMCNLRSAVAAAGAAVVQCI